jgi:hypothetical protein
VRKSKISAGSPHLAERFRALWIAALLDKRLNRCSDHEIGALLSFAQDRFHIFDPEFAICDYAQRTLLRSPGIGVRDEYIDEDRGGK